MHCVSSIQPLDRSSIIVFTIIAVDNSVACIVLHAPMTSIQAG